MGVEPCCLVGSLCFLPNSILELVVVVVAIVVIVDVVVVVIVRVFVLCRYVVWEI